jgi:hypothetical protein
MRHPAATAFTQVSTFALRGQYQFDLTRDRRVISTTGKVGISERKRSANSLKYCILDTDVSTWRIDAISIVVAVKIVAGKCVKILTGHKRRCQKSASEESPIDGVRIVSLAMLEDSAALGATIHPANNNKIFKNLTISILPCCYELYAKKSNTTPKSQLR